MGMKLAWRSDRQVNDARPIAKTDLSALYDLFHARLLLRTRPIKVDDKYGRGIRIRMVSLPYGPMWAEQFMQLTDMHKTAESERERQRESCDN